MIKIIFSDADGTLLDSGGNISQNNILACIVTQEKNIPIVINTGRYGMNALKIAKMIQADKYQGYIIGNDGAEIWSFKDNKWIYLSQINVKTTHKLAKWLLNYHSDLLLNFSSVSNMYVNRLYSKWDKWLEHLEISINKISNFNNIKDNISKIIIILEQYWDSEKIKKFISDFELEFSDLTIVQYHSNVFSIGNKNVSKGTAILWLCQHLNIDIKNVLAIGDSFNDLSMFEVVEHSVVVANAHETIKNYAEWIAPSNDDDGVYWTIKKYILKN